MLLLSKVVTQFYIGPFISKELEVHLHQNINYPVHSHLGDKTQLLPSTSCQDTARQLRATIIEQGHGQDALFEEE